MIENRFFICRKCGNVVGFVEDKGGKLFCCGKSMEQLTDNNSEKAENHKPIIEMTDNLLRVRIGKKTHIMKDDHSITWIYLQTDRGGHRKCLDKNSQPVVDFVLTDEEPLAVYAYCNLDGMWITEI
ncbi:MAG: desulfoferrodoxin [Clostridia bacterium]|nr:desulfoferrodoxin [Clostridia bacterium]